MTAFLLVGRTGVEPVTNGLKGRYALIAQWGFPLCRGRIDGLKSRFSPAVCQKSPTFPTPPGGRRMEEVNEDRLEAQEFYEVCQQYRHAPDAVAPDGSLTASEAFEELKGWVRGYVAAAVLKDRKTRAMARAQEQGLARPVNPLLPPNAAYFGMGA